MKLENKNKNKNYSGFTLLELTIVIAIVGIMTSVALISMSPARETEKLKTAQREVASAIKLAQSYALQGKTHGGTTPDRYGIKFTSTSEYEIYAGVAETIVEKLKLPDGVTLTRPETATSMNIYFEVPHADVTGDDKELEFKGPGGTTKTIKIEKGGAIAEN